MKRWIKWSVSSAELEERWKRSKAKVLDGERDQSVNWCFWFLSLYPHSILTFITEPFLLLVERENQSPSQLIHPSVLLRGRERERIANDCHFLWSTKKEGNRWIAWRRWEKKKKKLEKGENKSQRLIKQSFHKKNKKQDQEEEDGERIGSKEGDKKTGK